MPTQIDAIDLKGQIPATVTATTAPVGDNDISISTTAFVKNEFDARPVTFSADFVNTGTALSPNVELAVDPATKQDVLVSGTNIKTINGTSVLGSGNVVISGGGSQTPLLQNVDGAQFGINNLSSLQVQKVTPATQNLVLSSRDLSNATYWEVASNITPAATTEDGTLGTDTLYLMTGSNAGDNFFHQTVTVVPGTEYFLYMDVRRGTNTAHTFSVRDLTNFVDIIAPTDIFSSTSNVVTRVMFSFIAPASCTSVRIFPVRGLTGNLYLGDIQLTNIEDAEYAVTTDTIIQEGADSIDMLCTTPTGRVGIGTPTPNSKLQVFGSFAQQIRSVNVGTQITEFDCILSCLASVNYNVTLPTCQNIIGRIYTIKNLSASSSAITVNCTGSENIDLLPSVILSPGEFITVSSNQDSGGVSWSIISRGNSFLNHSFTSASTTVNLSAASQTLTYFDGSFDVNLPAANTLSGRTFTLKNIGTGTVNIVANGANTIDGLSSIALTQWQAITIQAISTNLWYIINKV